MYNYIQLTVFCLTKSYRYTKVLFPKSDDKELLLNSNKKASCHVTFVICNSADRNAVPVLRCIQSLIFYFFSKTNENENKDDWRITCAHVVTALYIIINEIFNFVMMYSYYLKLYFSYIRFMYKVFLFGDDETAAGGFFFRGGGRLSIKDCMIACVLFWWLFLHNKYSWALCSDDFFCLILSCFSSNKYILINVHLYS